MSVSNTRVRCLLPVFFLVLTGCIVPIDSYTDPIGEGDILPNGTVSEIQANPKRNATPAEVAAIQRAVRTNPLLSDTQVVSDVQVEAVKKPIMGFCGRLQESVDSGAVVTGVLKTAEDKLLAYDLRYGEQAQLRCDYMNFWHNSGQ